MSDEKEPWFGYERWAATPEAMMHAQARAKAASPIRHRARARRIRTLLGALAVVSIVIGGLAVVFAAGVFIGRIS